ncbi:Aldehyde dehydrogenase, dimeric NADP-preferring [Hypsizygus marmoreus]|uniref:Aldehyde dehydrogenase n=1 Tax=Hypsizygus marmoreus TaxID=39966 RepID=A0A369K846_HYPMA|nr:Aldehyde dehydrogenase, dimeric NADP-preferring [Hypsizygus marmoreus]
MPELIYTSLEEIDKIHDELRAGFQSGKLKSIAYRKYQLLRLAYLVKDNAKRFEKALASDLGRPPLEGHFIEISSSISEIKTAYSGVEKWAKPEKPAFSLNFSVMRPVIYKEAKGVVLIISPFNYPLWLSVGPLAGALAAGNAVVLKPSESTPATSALLAELIPKYLDRDLVRVVNGAIPESTKLLSLQWDHILYTGSARVAKLVAAAAAKHLTPITLELGGKSPVIIDPECDLPMAARRILWGKVVNAGQTCVAPDYILVPRSFQDKFVQALKDAYESFYPESADVSSPAAYSRIVTPQAFRRIKGLLDGTKGEVVFGGETDEADKFIAPTAVRDVKADDSLMSEEIFGPLLPIVPVEDVDEAIAFINARDHPLALYVFSQNPAFKAKVFNSTQSGAAVANDTIIHPGAEGLPFGGVGPSGYGAHTGKFGFDTFTHLRSSLDSPGWVDKIIGFRFPPYTDAKLKSAMKLLPSLPARPKGPPSAASSRKWWGKWFFLALVVVVAGGLTTRIKMLGAK